MSRAMSKGHYSKFVSNKYLNIYAIILSTAWFVFVMSLATAKATSTEKPSDVLSLPIEGQSLFSAEKILIGGVAASTGSAKPIVVAFLSTKCPCSNSHVEELNRLKNDFPEADFFGIHSNADETEGEAKAYFGQRGLKIPVIQDQHTKLADVFKARKTPHVYVLSAKGEVLFRGGFSDSHIFADRKHNYLREALEDLRASRSIRTSEARTLGCAIARETDG